MRTTPLAVVLVMALAIAPASAFGQSAAPDLSGENFAAFSNSVLGGVGSVDTTSRSCDVNGEGSLSVIATGPAAGPYPGTFREELSVTLGERLRETPDSERPVRTLNATFTIDSPAGQVSGTKSFDPSQSNALGECFNDSRFPGDPSPPFFDAGGQFTSYTATITTPQGCTFRDTGSATFNLIDSGGGTGRVFGEDFFTDGRRPVLVGTCGGGGDDDEGDDDDDEGDEGDDD